MQIQEVTTESDFAGCYNRQDPMAKMTARERFLLRVHSVLDERDLNQKDLKGANSEGWISNKLRGQRDVKLNEAEQIADALQVPLAELLRKPEDSVYELDNVESRLVEAFRQLSKPEQDAFVLTVTLRHRPAPYPTGRKVAHRPSSLQPGGVHGSAASARGATASTADEIRALTSEFDRRLAEALGESGGQTSSARRPVPAAPKRGRNLR